MTATARSTKSKKTTAGPVELPRVNAGAELRALRKKRLRALALRGALGVLLPTLMSVLFYWTIASSQFESVSLFTIQSADGRQAASLETLIGAIPGAAATRDTLAVRDYILSRDMLQKLDKEHAFVQRYQDPAVDWFSRLGEDASLEDAYEYYLDKVRADYDNNSGVVTLSVKAFTAEYAGKLALAILGHSEKMVNQLSERARLDQTKLARQEVSQAEERLVKARQAVVALQQEHGEFSPERTAAEALTIRSQLKAELAKARAEVMQAKSFMKADAPKVVSLTERANSLAAQVAGESRRLVNPKAEKGLNTSASEFESALLEKEFAANAYQSTLTSLEVARTEAARQHRYLTTIANPSVPDEETHPRRLRGVLTVFLMSFMGLGIVSLLVAAVREHARV